MTRDEYDRLRVQIDAEAARERDRIEAKRRDDHAALRRVWLVAQTAAEHEKPSGLPRLSPSSQTRGRTETIREVMLRVARELGSEFDSETLWSHILAEPEYAGARRDTLATTLSRLVRSGAIVAKVKPQGRRKGTYAVPTPTQGEVA